MQQLSYEKAVEVCFLRKMELISYDLLYERFHLYFIGKIDTKFFKEGKFG